MLKLNLIKITKKIKLNFFYQAMKMIPEKEVISDENFFESCCGRKTVAVGGSNHW